MEVRVILDAGAGIDAAPWIYAEFTGVDLGDERLNKRLVMTAGFLGASPVSPINEACLDWKGTKGAYRFFDNERVTPENMRAPHLAAAGQRMIAATEGEQKFLLAPSDTAFISYKHPMVAGLGPIGKDNDEGLGLVMHSVLAITTGGTPLGVLHQHIWAQGEIPEETRQEKIERLQQTPVEEKESWKWDPQRRGRAKDPTMPDEITVRLVSATETSTPEDGDEAISWVLMTSFLVPTSMRRRRRCYGTASVASLRLFIGC